MWLTDWTTTTETLFNDAFVAVNGSGGDSFRPPQKEVEVMSESQWEKDYDAGKVRVDPDTGEFYGKTSWAAQDLAPYLRGEQVIAPPRYLLRQDGKALLYPGRPHVFYGESESLKTWAAILACKSVVDVGERAVYVDLEGSEASFVERARMVGIQDADLGVTLNYVRPMEPLQGTAAIDFWHHEMDLFAPSFVVLDGVTELYALQGWDINSQTDAARFQATFAFQRGGVTSVAIDHTPKDAGRGVIGAQHKRAGLDGAEYLFEPMVAAGRGRRGMARITVTKDRHGRIREWANPNVGKIVVDDAPDAAEVFIEAPTFAEQVDPKDDAMDRVIEYLREHPGSTRKAIAESVPLQTQRIHGAINTLDSLRRIENRGGKGKGAWYVVIEGES
jgi:AAA domain